MGTDPAPLGTGTARPSRRRAASAWPECEGWPPPSWDRALPDPEHRRVSSPHTEGLAEPPAPTPPMHRGLPHSSSASGSEVCLAAAKRHHKVRTGPSANIHEGVCTCLWGSRCSVAKPSVTEWLLLLLSFPLSFGNERFVPCTKDLSPLFSVEQIR